jgi:hypothetical protein
MQVFYLELDVIEHSKSDLIKEYLFAECVFDRFLKFDF